MVAPLVPPVPFSLVPPGSPCKFPKPNILKQHILDNAKCANPTFAIGKSAKARFADATFATTKFAKDKFVKMIC